MKSARVFGKKNTLISAAHLPSSRRLCSPRPPPRLASPQKMSTTTNMSIGAEGLCVRQTEATAGALRRASRASTPTVGSKSSTTPVRVGTPPSLKEISVSEDLGAEAALYVDAEEVPFRLLKRVCEALRADAAARGGDGGDGGPWLQDLVRGGGVALKPPKRPPRNAELEARCQQLRDEMAQKEYDEMTKDVMGTGTRRGGEGLKMSTLTRELGFGAHVITMMAACFVGGVVTGEAFKNKIIRNFFAHSLPVRYVQSPPRL